jgi:hypothetical protein
VGRLTEAVSYYYYRQSRFCQSPWPIFLDRGQANNWAGNDSAKQVICFLWFVAIGLLINPFLTKTPPDSIAGGEV